MLIAIFFKVAMMRSAELIRIWVRSASKVVSDMDSEFSMGQCSLFSSSNSWGEAFSG